MNWVQRRVAKRAALNMAKMLEGAMNKRRLAYRMAGHSSNPQIVRMDMHLFAMLKAANEVLDIYEGKLRKKG